MNLSLLMTIFTLICFNRRIHFYKPQVSILAFVQAHIWEHKELLKTLQKGTAYPFLQNFYVRQWASQICALIYTGSPKGTEKLLNLETPDFIMMKSRQLTLTTTPSK